MLSSVAGGRSCTPHHVQLQQVAAAPRSAHEHSNGVGGRDTYVELVGLAGEGSVGTGAAWQWGGGLCRVAVNAHLPKQDRGREQGVTVHTGHMAEQKVIDWRYEPTFGDMSRSASVRPRRRPRARHGVVVGLGVCNCRDWCCFDCGTAALGMGRLHGRRLPHTCVGAQVLPKILSVLLRLASRKGEYTWRTLSLVCDANLRAALCRFVLDHARVWLRIQQPWEMAYASLTTSDCASRPPAPCRFDRTSSVGRQLVGRTSCLE